MKKGAILILFLIFLSVMTGHAAPKEQLLKLDSVVVHGYTKYEYAYNPQGELISEKFFVAKDSALMNYVLMSLVEHHYENGKRVSSVNSFNFEDGLEMSDRTVYEYDNAKLSVERHEHYQNNDQWFCDVKSLHHYREDELLSETERLVFTGGDFLLTEKTEYAYDEQSKDLQNIVSKMLISENQWKNKTKTEFEYDGGNLILRMEFVWNDTISDWRMTSKKEFFFDETNRNKVTYKESTAGGDGFVTVVEKEITLDVTCPSENLILPYENELPYKVDNEYDAGVQKNSRYYYSELSETGLNTLPDPAETVIYPNPAEDSFYLRSARKVSVVEIFDMTGKQVAVYAGGIDRFDISTLSRGIYSVRINIDGESEILKLVKK